jgi:hypothetical protein
LVGSNIHQAHKGRKTINLIHGPLVYRPPSQPRCSIRSPAEGAARKNDSVLDRLS